ncbi:MAG: single-stranded-DNA-specific exonuclease RecJ [Candidatus Niyogibacteria bacterium]|nr:single-stranded-DNA-specific exonuclease RecJ [Candidatus Niyogibacteria bacterium]
MPKKWVIKEKYPESLVAEFANENAVGLQLLWNRGVRTSAERDALFNFDYERGLPDPLLHKDMRKAAERIITAVEKNERVIVYGDYDADGMSGATVFHDFFKRIGFNNFDVYIPDRFSEGYGLSFASINSFMEQKPTLVITVDCGVTSVAEIKHLEDHGVNVIVTDHHLVPPEAPQPYALVDAKQDGDEYPFKFLCGAGTAFKVVQAILALKTFNLPKGWEKWLLDVVAIATIADMVAMRDENRTLTHFGLAVLRKTRRAGLLALFKKLRIDPAHLGEDDIAFGIAPHVNAASRMGHETTGFELLTTDSPEEAEWLAKKIIETRAAQRTQVDDVLAEIKARFEGRSDLPEAIVAGNEKWSPGVLGIVANRLQDFYLRPIFLWGRGAESKDIKGSARSREYSVVNIMRLMPEGFFKDFGGHHAAGGFSAAPEKAAELEAAILDAVRRTPKHEMEEELTIDQEVSLEQVDRKLLSNILRFGPFGIENPAPQFLFKGLEVKHAKNLGSEGLHIKLSFHKASGEEVSAVSWFRKESAANFTPGMLLDVVGSVEMSRFNGKSEIRIGMADFRPTETE